MMETLEAADLEKQKHNNTRMEVLARLAGLEVLPNGLICLLTVQIALTVISRAR